MWSWIKTNFWMQVALVVVVVVLVFGWWMRDCGGSDAAKRDAQIARQQAESLGVEIKQRDRVIAELDSLRLLEAARAEDADRERLAVVTRYVARREVLRITDTSAVRTVIALADSALAQADTTINLFRSALAAADSVIVEQQGTIALRDQRDSARVREIEALERQVRAEKRRLTMYRWRPKVGVGAAAIIDVTGVPRVGAGVTLGWTF